MEQKSTDILPKEERQEYFKKICLGGITQKEILDFIQRLYKSLTSAEAEIESLKTLLEESEKEKERLKELNNQVLERTFHTGFLRGMDTDSMNPEESSSYYSDSWNEFKKENNLD